MKKIDAGVMPKSYNGHNMGTFARDAKGDRKVVEGKLEPKEATLADILLDFLDTFQTLAINGKLSITYQDSRRVNRIFPKLVGDLGVVEIDDDDYSWLMEKLGEDKVGAAIFAANAYAVVEALKSATEK